MALFVAGQTCPLCGEPIASADEARLFPPLIRNPVDPLHVFDDGAFHKACVDAHPLADKINQIEAQQTAFYASPKVCSVSGEALTADTALALPFLTDDPALAAYPLNFTWFSRTALQNDAVRSSVLGALSSLSNDWDANALDVLRADIKSAPV